MIGLIISAISALGGLGAVGLLRGKWKIDKETIAKMERDRNDADAKRDTERRMADEERDRKRRLDDEERSKDLRTELGVLSKLSFERFKSWRAAQADLDEVWEYIDQHAPWDNEAYQKLNQHGIAISPPPTLKPRKSRVVDIHHDDEHLLRLEDDPASDGDIPT